MKACTLVTLETAFALIFGSSCFKTTSPSHKFRALYSLNLRGGGEEAGSLSSPILRQHFTKGAVQIGNAHGDGYYDSGTKFNAETKSNNDGKPLDGFENQPWFQEASKGSRPLCLTALE
jgi:hypothetical protein